MQKFNKEIKFEYLIFLSAIILCYFNVIEHPQVYYDDYTNIFAFKLLGDGFNFHSLINAMKFHVGGFRPVSYLSFYLNHYLFHGNLRSFIIINVLIHFFNTIIFYKIALKLTKDKKLSFFTALFWAVNPVNLFAVSYLVQRMTSLMALFGGIATIYYLKWEESKEKNHLILALIFVIFSALSKENGILFVGFFMVHYYIKNGNTKDILEVYITGILFLILLYIFCKNYFLIKYLERQINPLQRFLTELRVLFFYMQNIVFPLEKNIFLITELTPSKSLIQPTTTLLSLIGILILLCISFITTKRDKVISIGILGFFLFHLIESTFLPLLQAFWHRNYVASFFLILAILKSLTYLKSKIKYIIITILILNSIWITSLHNLKWIFSPFYIKKNYQSYKNSVLTKNWYALELEKEGKYEDALKIYLQLLRTYNRTIAFIRLVNIFYIKGKYQEAINLANLYPKNDPEVLKTIGECYVNLNKPQKAEAYFKQSLKRYFQPSTLMSYLKLLYENKLYDKVVFTIEDYQKQLIDLAMKNQSFQNIFKTKNYLTKIMLLKIECKIRINLNNLDNDIEILKKYGVFNKNVENYIFGLKELSKKHYASALKYLNKISLTHLDDLNFFINYKKIILTLCIYDKTGEKEKFKKVIEKLSKNSIIYSKIWEGLDKCY